jgi:lathosterol oxidase
MLDWMKDVGNALGDAGAWQLLGRVVELATLQEAWHYALVAVLVWVGLHVLLKNRLAHRLIGQWPGAAAIRREMTYSLGTVLVFAGLNGLVLALVVSGRSDIYSDPMAHGLLWLVASLPLLIVWQDFYFYWTHRLMHTRWLFRHVHGVHHRSRHPSPWAAYAFHPIEALNNSVMLLIPLATLPMNEGVLFLFWLHQIVRNTVGHAAVETMPGGFARHAFWGQFITTTHHHLHHETARGNYGLWFTWWDRWGGTERPDYLARFDTVTSRPRPGRAPAAITPSEEAQRPPESGLSR